MPVTCGIPSRAPDCGGAVLTARKRSRNGGGTLTRSPRPPIWPTPLENLAVRFVRRDPPGVPTGWWRGVGPTRSVFAVESFMDELAAAGAAGSGVRYRRALLKEAAHARGARSRGRSRRVGHGAAGRHVARGVSIQFAFGSYPSRRVAEVAVKRAGPSARRARRMREDCGQVVNPRWGRAPARRRRDRLAPSAVLGNEITIANGRVEQSNFNNFPSLRMSEAPRVEVASGGRRRAPGGCRGDRHLVRRCGAVQCDICRHRQSACARCR